MSGILRYGSAPCKPEFSHAAETDRDVGKRRPVRQRPMLVRPIQCGGNTPLGSNPICPIGTAGDMCLNILSYHMVSSIGHSGGHLIASGMLWIFPLSTTDQAEHDSKRRSGYENPKPPVTGTGSGKWRPADAIISQTAAV